LPLVSQLKKMEGGGRFQYGRGLNVFYCKKNNLKKCVVRVSAVCQGVVWFGSVVFK